MQLENNKEWLVLGYISEATRNFDVAIKQGTERFNQKDEQGILRYGIQLEKNIIKHLNLRISARTLVRILETKKRTSP